MAIPDNFYVVIAILVLAIFFIASSSFFVLWAKNQTNVNMLLAWYFMAFTIGIIVDCIRAIVIFGLKLHLPDIDWFTYLLKCVLIFVAFLLIPGIHIVLCNYVGIPMKYSKLLIGYLIVVGALITVGCIYYSFPTPIAESGFYIMQFDPVLYVATFIAYLPMAAVIFFRNLDILQRVKNKNTRLKLIIFTTLTIFLVGERGFTLGGYHLANLLLGIPIDMSLLLDFIALTIIAFFFIGTIIKYPDFMESVGTYFSIKKLYILKDNGLLLFEYDYDERKFLDGADTSDTLIGGFIYAVSEGFKEVLKSDENIHAFSSGNRSVLIHRGESVFCVLIVTEDSPLLHRKLIGFITQFEEMYGAELKTWAGEFSKFDYNKIQKLIFEALREN